MIVTDLDADWLRLFYHQLVAEGAQVRARRRGAGYGWTMLDPRSRDFFAQFLTFQRDVATSSPHWAAAVWAITVSFLVLPPGCETDANRLGSRRSNDTLPTTAIGRGEASRTPKPVAIVSGDRVFLDDLSQYLAEAAGAIALEEFTLDRELDRALTARGLSVSGDEIRDEQRQLTESIAQQAAVSEDDAARLVEQLRTARGLGPIRYPATLARNAKLRALVRGQVQVSPEEARQVVAGRFGARVRARVITTETQQAAAETQARLQADGLSASRFSEEAGRVSTDETSSRGGLVPELGLEDPSYPAVLRQAAAGLAPGAMSPVIALDRGFALVLVESKIPATTPPAGEEERAMAVLRLRRERVAMDRLARELVSRAGVVVMDDGLRWSWSRRRGSADAGLE